MVTTPPSKLVRKDSGLLSIVGPEAIRCVLSAAETGGAYALYAVECDASKAGPPLHIHAEGDEMFMVDEGELTMFVGGVRHTLRAGDAMFAPRGVPHRYEVGYGGARYRILFSGRSVDGFFEEAADIFATGEMHRLAALGEAYGVTFLRE